MTIAATDGGPLDQSGSTTMQSAEPELWDGFQHTTEGLPRGQTSGGDLLVGGINPSRLPASAVQSTDAGVLEQARKGSQEEVGLGLKESVSSPKQTLQADGLRQSQSHPRPGVSPGSSPRGRSPLTHAQELLSEEAVAAQRVYGQASEAGLQLGNLSGDDIPEDPSLSPASLQHDNDRDAPTDRHLRPATRTGGSYKSLESPPVGVISPRAGVTSTAVLALPAPDRPVNTTVRRRAKGLQGARTAKLDGAGGSGQPVFAPPPQPEVNRQSDAEGEQSGSGLLEGGVSGRSGTTSGGKVPRECSVCHLNKSPRWRTGPEGPKTLCNRCGVYWSQNRHKWDELVDRFKATSDGEVNQLQAEFKAVRHAKSADLEQRRAKLARQPPKAPVPGVSNIRGPVPGVSNVRGPRKASNLSRVEGHSRSDTETILRKLQELPGHFAKSLRKELLGFGLVRSASPKPETEGVQGGAGAQQQQAEAAEEEVVISSGSDDEGGHEQARGSHAAGPSGRALDALMQGNGSSNNLGSAALVSGGFGPSPATTGSSFPGDAHPGENKAKRKRSETKIVRDSLTQTGVKKARLIPGDTAVDDGAEPRVGRKEEDVIKEAEELLRTGGLGGSPSRGTVAGHFVSGKKSGGQRTVKVTERKTPVGAPEGKPPGSVGIVINSSGLAKIRIGGVTRIVQTGEPVPEVDMYGIPIPKKKKPGRPPSAAKLAARLAAARDSVVDLSGKTHLKVDLPGGGAGQNVEGGVPEGMTPTIRSARIKARGPAPDFTDDFEDDEGEILPVKKRRGRPPSGKMSSLGQLPDVKEGGRRYKGAKRGRKPKNWTGDPSEKPARKRGRPANSQLEFSSKLDEFQKVFKPSVRRTKRPRIGVRNSVDFGSPSGEFPLVPDSLLMPPFPSVPELMLPSRLQKARSHSPALGASLGSLKPRLPLQVDDITVESFGSIDPQHITVESGRICAIGYRSTWKDPTLGLVHVSEVIAGEDGKPIYTVTCRLKERTDDEERSIGGARSPFGRSQSFQVQRSPRSPIQRSFSLQDGRFRLAAPSPLGQNQQSAFAQTGGVEQRPSEVAEKGAEVAVGPVEAPIANPVPQEDKSAALPAVVQGWAAAPSLLNAPEQPHVPEEAELALTPREVRTSPPLEGTKPLVKEPTISPLLVGKPGPPIEALKGFDGAADLHDLDTAMIWDEDFHVAFGEAERGPGTGFGPSLGDVNGGRRSEGQELGWGFGLGTEQDKAQGSLWGVNAPVSEQEAEEGMLAVFRGPGEGARLDSPQAEAPKLEPTPSNEPTQADATVAEMFGGASALEVLPTVKKESPPKAAFPPAIHPQYLQGVTVRPVTSSSQPTGLLRIHADLPPLPASLHINTHPLLERQESLPKPVLPGALAPEVEPSPQPRRPGRPRRQDAKPLPAVSIPDRQLRSEKQSQGVETPRTAHRRLTGSDLLVKRSSPEEAWKAYAAAWRETFEARAPQHLEEIDWEEFERDHFGLEKPEVVQWIADLFQASPRLTQARRSFQNLQLMPHPGPGPSLLQPAPKPDADRPATRAEEKEALDAAARAKRQVAEAMRRQLVLFSDRVEEQPKEGDGEQLVLEGVSVVEVQEALQVYELLSSVSSIHLPPLDVFLSGLIHPTASASLINTQGVTRGKPKLKGPATSLLTAGNTPAPAGNASATAGKESKEPDASDAVAGLHLQLVKHAVAKLGSDKQGIPKLSTPRQETSPGPVTTPGGDSFPASEGETSEAGGLPGPLPQTPRPLEEASPSGGLSDSGEKVPARVSTRAPKWKAGLTNGEAPWALLMSRNMAKLNGTEKGPETHHEGSPFRHGLELLDGLTWPAFARRVLEDEVKAPGLPTEEEAPPAVESVPVSAVEAEDVKLEPETGPTVEEEEPVPLPIILTPVEIVRRAEKEAEVLAEAERQLARASALLKGHEGPVTETAAPSLGTSLAFAGAPESAAPTPVSTQQAAGEEEQMEPLEKYEFWWSPLEGLGPMNSNQGSKIRGRIQTALAMRPPEWARSDLEKVITRDVYRSSAGGPMKRMALSVLERVHQFQAGSEKPSLAQFHTTKMCREVIRLVAEQDDIKIFSNLPDEVEDRFSLEGFRIKAEPYRVRTKGFRVLAGEKRGLKRSHEEAASEEVPCGYTRPVDLRTIDMRLAARAYGSSLELFLADVRMVWENARQQFPLESKEVRTAEELSELFDRLYQEKVLNLGPDGLPLPKLSSRPPKDLTIRISDPVWGRLPKAPWEWEGCKVCGIDENDAQVLLCDQCSAEYHTYCLDPPLARIPDGDWLCHNCLDSRPTPLASPTPGRPGRKKGSGGRPRTTDGRRVKIRVRPNGARRPSSDENGERKKRGRPLSAKGAERRAAEERTAERKAAARFARETAVGASVFRMERFSGVLALEAPESPAIRAARLAEEEAEARGEMPAEVPIEMEVPMAPVALMAPVVPVIAEASVTTAEERDAKPKEVSVPEVPKPVEDDKPVVKPLEPRDPPESTAVELPAAVAGSAALATPLEEAKPVEDVKPVGAGQGPDGAPGGETRALRSQGAVTPEPKPEKKKRKGQNQWTKRKELAELAAKLAAEGKPVPPQPVRKHQNQYTKRKERELAAAAAEAGKDALVKAAAEAGNESSAKAVEVGEKAPTKAASSPASKLKAGVSVASRLKIARGVKSAGRAKGSPEGQGVKGSPGKKEGVKTPEGVKESPGKKRAVEEQPKKGGQSQQVKKEPAEPGVEVKRKGENQYTKAKRLAEEAQREKEKEKRKGENQYTKAKRLAEEAEAKKVAEAAEPKRKGENQYTKAKRLAEEAAKAKEERRAAKERRRAEKAKRLEEQEKEGKKRGENQYTKAKKLAEGGAKKPAEGGVKKSAEGRPKKVATGSEVKRRGENQYTKAKRLAEEAAKEARREKRREQKRKGENQYTKAKKLAALASEGGQPGPSTEAEGPSVTHPTEEKASEAKPAVAAPEGVPPTSAPVPPTGEAPKPPDLEAGLEVKPAPAPVAKPHRKRENQYTKRKRLLEQGIEVKPTRLEPRSGLRSKDPETPKLRSGATLKQEKGPDGEPVVYYTRRKLARGESKGGAEQASEAGASLQLVKAEPDDGAAVELAQPDQPKSDAGGDQANTGPVGEVALEVPPHAQLAGDPPAEEQSSVQAAEGKPEPAAAVGEPRREESNVVQQPIKVEASGVAPSVAPATEDKEAADVTPAPPGAPADVTASAGAAPGTGAHAASGPGPADVSGAVPVPEGRPAKRPKRLTIGDAPSEFGGAIVRASQGGERKERRPLQSRGPMVKAIEPPKERTPEQRLADRMGECAYWELTLSERLHLFKALAKRAADVTPSDAAQKPVPLGSDAGGALYWVLTCPSGPLLLTGKPAPSSELAPSAPESTSVATQRTDDSEPASFPDLTAEPISVAVPSAAGQPGEVGAEMKAEAGPEGRLSESKESPGAESLTPAEPQAEGVAAEVGVMPMEVDGSAADAKSPIEGPSKETVTRVEPAPSGLSEPKREESGAGEKEKPILTEGTVEGGASEAAPEDGEAARADGGEEKDRSLRKGTWSVVASLEELEAVTSRVTSAEGAASESAEQSTLAESLAAWDGRLREGLDIFKRREKRPRDEDDGAFTSRKKQRVAEEECAPGQPLRATELLLERERGVGENRAVPRCVCGEPLVAPRVHCPFCHCSADKGPRAFSHWCDRPHGCLLLEELRRVEASPATGPFGLPAGADALEESQADLEVLEGLEIDLQAVFAEGLDYPGLGGVASAPFASLARSPPRRVALNRLNRSPNPPGSELPPPAVPFGDGFFKPPQTSPKPEPLLPHAQSFPSFAPSGAAAKTLNPAAPLGSSASLPADTTALVPFVPNPPPAAADVSASAAPGDPSPETPRKVEDAAEGAVIETQNPKPPGPARWIVEGGEPALAKVKMDLLDMEAALSPQCLGGVRATPERCNAWRVLVKRAQSAKDLAYAAVLLELMIRPALISKEWAVMGPLSRAMADGRGGTIAQVAMMVHSLDGVIDYEGLQSAKESNKRKRVR